MDYKNLSKIANFKNQVSNLKKVKDSTEKLGITGISADLWFNIYVADKETMSKHLGKKSSPVSALGYSDPEDISYWDEGKCETWGSGASSKEDIIKDLKSDIKRELGMPIIFSQTNTKMSGVDSHKLIMMVSRSHLVSSLKNWALK